MNIVVYFVLLMAVEPVPTYGFLQDFKSMKDCHEHKVTVVKEHKLTKEQASRFACVTVFLGEVSEPV